MKKALGVIITAVLLTGCSSQFWGGTAAGSVGAAGGYEFNIHRQMQRIEEDLKAGKINQQEYDIRKDQIQRDSLLK